MKRIYVTLALLFCITILNAQINDSFTDGDYTVNPTWTVSAVSDFTVVSGQLKSTNVTPNFNFYISTTNTLAVNCQWEFYINLQFNTSSANYVDVYLVSNEANLQASTINGYFVRVGGTLDEICLYKRSGTLATAVKIIDGTNGITNIANNTLKIKVTRTAAHLFSLERDLTGTGSHYILEGNVTDGAYTSTSSFGFYIQQSTSSFVKKHVFDEVMITPLVLDVIPPTLISATATSSTTIDVLFNEAVDLISAQTTGNYTISSGIGSPFSATKDAVNPQLVHLVLSAALASGHSYTVSLNAVQDLAGNAMINAITVFTCVLLGNPVFKDITIHEIYADPSPRLQLTSTEFVELYNRSATFFNLSGLTLTDHSSTATLGNYTLAPNGYVIICPVVDTAEFTALGYLNKLGVSSFPSLNNSGDNLYLITPNNITIDSVNYKDSWYRDAVKKEGGYTLEQINPNQPSSCPQANNWIGSTNVRGGTPGFMNSVYSAEPDVVGPSIIEISIVDSTHVTVCFDDVISPVQLASVSNYTVNGAIGSPSLVIPSFDNTCATLSLSNKLTNATHYTLMVSGITDCNGNALNPKQNSFSYYQHKAYDIVFNELMPDPDPAMHLPNEEYVELKNRTAFSIHLLNWTLTAGTSTKKIPHITIKPDSFVVLTSTGNANTFSQSGIKVYEMTNFPSLLNDGTTVTLRDSNGVVIHSITYSSSWYHDPNKAEG